jgi:selenoprotein W-related protein
MALELLTHYRKDISDLKLVPSGGGAFEVSVNGKLVFSKLEEGRFPEPKELRQSIEAA